MSKLPEVLNFEGIGRCFYSKGEFRAPRAGEFYLSGAVVAAYQAKSDFESAYRIVKPVALAERRTVETRGASV